MLTLHGQKLTCCDGIPRRSFLKAGFLGLAGLSLPQALQARAAAAVGGQEVRKTSVILVNLLGGPSQFETYDPKPDAPSEYRGHFEALKTNVPGVWFSELMAKQAKVMDKMAIVRSISGSQSHHWLANHQLQTGVPGRLDAWRNTLPSMGSVTARVRGANAKGVPAYSIISKGRSDATLQGTGAYLGRAFDPFVINGDPNSKDFKIRDLSLTANLSVERLEDRRRLLRSIDSTRRAVDQNAESLDQFTAQAFDLVTGDRAQKAFDIGQELPGVRDLYGRTQVGQSLLLARRLVEAGVTFVTVALYNWDDHNIIKPKMERRAPAYDQGMAALVSDLYDRGLDRDVLVVAMGEFGRTPKINANEGRDHWAPVMSVLFSGGGMKVGQVVGASNRRGEEPVDAPYSPHCVLRTMYHHLGVDPSMTFDDLAGRPRYLLEHGEVIKELI